MIDKSTAGSGGAIYLSTTDYQTVLTTVGGIRNVQTGQNVISIPNPKGTITGGSITGCQAVNGSAVYVGNSATFSGDLEVSGNTVSDINSGAIQTVNTGKLYFEGNVRVEDNTCTADSAYNHDVLMQIDGNTIINTTSSGLDSGAKIGVYVAGEDNGSSAYAKHGKQDQPFGTYAGSNYLDAFFNDRDSELYGCQRASNDTKIYWGIFVCKITDVDGNTLKRPNGRDAVYQSLSAAFDEFRQVKNGVDEPDKAVYVKMLLEAYDLRQDIAISNFPAADITLTTEAYRGTTPVEGRYDGKYPYRGASGTVCTISRTNSANELFKLNTDDAVFRLENITLDGRSDKTDTTGSFRLIEADKGALYINPGTMLQYGSADNGGAIYATNAPVTVNLDNNNTKASVKFLNCTARASGGAIRADSLTICGRENGVKGTLFKECTAASGGAVSVNGSTLSITGAEFEDCRTTTGEGGAVFHDDTTAESGTIKNSAFKSCYTDRSSGGAVSSKAGTLTVSQSSFDNCHAKQNGGAVNHAGTTKISITASTFTGSEADVSGGSVYTEAVTVEVTGGSFTGSTARGKGGALYCQSNADGSTTAVSGVSFENCSATDADGKGGAIFCMNKDLTLEKDSDTKTNTSINNCTAKDRSGAVYLETAGSVLNIKDSTVISNCYANMGGAIYLPSGVTMNLT